MCVRSSAMIHANQNQHGIERHRTKRIRCHAMNLAVLIHRDDGDAGRETSHGITKIILGDAHTAEDPLLKICRADGRRPARQLRLTTM